MDNMASGLLAPGGLEASDVSTAISTALNVLRDDSMNVEENLKRKREEVIEEHGQSSKLQVIPKEPIPIQATSTVLEAHPHAASGHSPQMEQDNVDGGESKTISNPRPRYYSTCLNNTYEITDNGPFYLYIESESYGKKIHPMFVGKIIRNNHLDLYKNIISIKKIDWFSIKIEVNNYVSANKIKMLSIWRENNLVSYIPNFLIYKQGLLRDVDYCLSDEEIKEYIVAEQAVTNARRIFKKDPQDLSKRVPTPLVIITFRGQSLPREVKILEVLCKVNKFEQKVQQCQFCLRFGHFQNKCRASNPQCRRCGGEHREGECQEVNVSCYNCKGNHFGTDPICPEFINQQKIKNIMNDSNISFKEAFLMMQNKNTYSQKVSSDPTPPEIDPENSYASPTYHLNKGNITDSQRKIHKIITIPSRPRTPRPYEAPHFDIQANISNNIMPASPIISDPTYLKNINTSDRLKVILNSVIQNLIINNVPLTFLNIPTEDSEFFMKEMRNNLGNIKNLIELN